MAELKDKIEWDEFREDVRRPDGSLVQANVLFIRGRFGNIEYHIPIWVEDGYAEGIDIKEDAKDILTEKIRKVIFLVAGSIE